MRLPRRVPWASVSELDQVCAWIYADENDIDAKILALHRLSAWKTITTLPHALESTLAILTAIVQDSSSQSSSSRLHIRQSYASAIIRLVNGLVDPLQLGAYARSIASIAAQLDLPAWLVELRHAATHEDLPSIEVLRDAARDAMGWLLHHYFLPSINPTTTQPSRAPPLRPVLPLLKQYKNVSKITVRDASLKANYKTETTKILRDIERWIAEAKVAADVSAATLEWELDSSADPEEDGREQWALEKFSDALLEKGGLVPVSKKKRAVKSSSFTPPSIALSIWAPLITHLQILHPSLPATLTSRIASRLTVHRAFSEEETILLDAEDTSQDTSYDMCIASWANWLVCTFGDSADEEDDGARLRREDLVISLGTSLGPTVQDSAENNEAALLLLKTLCADHPHLQDVAALLSAPTVGTSSEWSADDLDAMDKRLNALLNSRAGHVLPAQSAAFTDPQVSTETASSLPRGWRALSVSDGWKPAPIGVFLGS